MEQLHRLESVKGLAFVLASGVGYFAFASSLLKRIASQQQHLALIFHGVSDSLFLVQVEADDRYRFVSSDEVIRMLRARQFRSAAVSGKRSGGGVLWRARVAGSMAGQLFLRSYERSDRIYNAMMARGYAGQLRTLNPHILRGRDWMYAVLAFLFILAMQFVGRF